MFVIEVDGRRIARDGAAWTSDSDRELTDVIDQDPAVPLPLVHPSPIIEVDWADEVWVWLHTGQTVARHGLGSITIILRPEMPKLGELPDGAIP